MADHSIRRFLDTLSIEPSMLEEVKQFHCKQNCFQCGLCVSLADRHGLAITTAEMDAARRKFIAGELVLDGIRYAPNPEHVAALKRVFSQRLSFARLVPPPLRFKTCS